jgi:hypothetical protein
MSEWLVIDKVGDLHYFNKKTDIGEYFNLSNSEVDGVFQYSLRHINRYSPSQKIYIQRLYTDSSRPARSIDKIKFNWYAIKNIYPKIND